jgi:hypothetical protein
MEHLYRHFDKSGALLYVGISLNALNRLGQHKDHAHWFCQIARVEIENYPTRETAREAEKKAISSENPLHNLYRPTVKEQKAACQQSKGDLIKRIVQFNPTYSPEDVASILGMQRKEVQRELDNGNLGCFEVNGKASGRWPVRMKKRITGWQLIDYIEHLEQKK